MKYLFFLTFVVIFHTDFSEHSEVGAKIDGFTTDLISLDSPRSPFYNPSETKYQRLQKAFGRSIQSGKYFGATRMSPNDIQSDIILGRGAYLMNISIGTPPVPMLGIADTGSDLIWRQCVPCEECYQQIGPLFDPETSETYKILGCDTEFCQDLGRRGSCDTDNSCIYRSVYGTGQTSNSGYLSSDTLTIGSSDSTGAEPASFPGIAFGCAHSTTGDFGEKHVGIIGLGGGPFSLVKQLDSQVGGQFSYCLVPLSSETSTVSSKINFGSNGVVSGSGTVSTPRIEGGPDTFYYLKLEGMSIGSTRVEFNGFSSLGGEESNIIIDSGTTLTFLPPDFYSEVESALETAIGGQPASSGSSGLCYSSSSSSGSALVIPTITVHFAGADVQLPPLNTFIEAQEGLVCFTMVPSSQLFIFGNLAQMNFLVGYDLNNNMVSFKPTDCTKTMV